MKSNDIINELVIIGNWAKSCKTKEQLEVVNKFLDKKMYSYPKKHIGLEVSFHMGIVSGIILSLKKLKYGV